MSAIDKLKAHYDSRGVRKKEIPELELIVYATPMTLAEKDKLWKKSQIKGSEMQMLVYAIIEKATDEHGESLFTIEDKAALLNQCDADIIADLGGWIIGGDVDHEKNS